MEVFTREWLEAVDFKGFVTLHDLERALAPALPGI